MEITGHRDHSLLDVSVISALHELVGARQVRALEIFNFREQLFIRPRAWLQDGRVVTSGDSGLEQPGDPLTHYPLLLAAIEQHQNSVAETAADGSQRLWLPIWLNDKINGCLEISSAAPLSAEALHTMEGILRVYRNFQNLLDYSERDSLTGLLNRKTFDEHFSSMVSSALLPKDPLPAPSGTGGWPPASRRSPRSRRNTSNTSNTSNNGWR